MDISCAIEWGSSTRDVGQGMATIEGCQFVGITDTAIRYGNRSSILTVEGCRFDGCERAMRVWNCDRVVFNRCFLNKKPLTADEATAFQLEGGTFDARNSIFITTGQNTGVETAWFSMKPVQVNSHYGICIADCRFSDESNGTTLINWYVPGDVTFPAIPEGITIRDSYLEGGLSGVSGQDQSIVRLFECPNYINMRNNQGFVGTATVVWADGVDPASKVWTDQVNSPLHIDISGNCGGGGPASGHIPNGLPPGFEGKANLR